VDVEKEQWMYVGQEKRLGVEKEQHLDVEKA